MLGGWAVCLVHFREGWSVDGLCAWSMFGEDWLVNVLCV